MPTRVNFFIGWACFLTGKRSLKLHARNNIKFTIAFIVEM